MLNMIIILQLKFIKIVDSKLSKKTIDFFALLYILFPGKNLKIFRILSIVTSSLIVNNIFIFSIFLSE
jgi:hypothetical protein